jgi:hypothetical protein
MATTTRKVILIHGYSDQGASFRNWARKLRDRGIAVNQINICSYISLNNEITIPDIGEGLDRAIQALGWSPDEPFDAIVHSTGMLVIRAWLANNSKRPQSLKHLVGLAPATWGSPLAHKGRSWLGALFKGSRQLGPDFLNAGDLILEGLELGSRFTWELSHRDLIADKPLFTTGPESPYVAVFIGNQSYGGIRELIHEPGADGTVRWSGCALNTRKITVDLRKAADEMFSISDWAANRLAAPMFAVEGKNHDTLLLEPEDDLADHVVAFLNISSAAEYKQWADATSAACASALQQMKKDHDQENDGWQQFVTRVTDEYGGPISDYVVDLFTDDPSTYDNSELPQIELTAFDLDVHPFKSDQSFRCFHMSIPKGMLDSTTNSLWMRLTASSGTELIAYQGYTPNAENISASSPVVLNLSNLSEKGGTLFYPFTTTLVEIKLNREPLPFAGQTRLLTMAPFDPGAQ